ncbi:TetR/AcrR family transcriptional regulator [Yinghuangia seranimata]|uniref:TetR/AcrR family transcriptional regulator n=1 Tax=Yinghuangia seranimata TaxID=408067 RepID=UPI00248CE33B|nr:TetR/AcrR family transcriptional regulator [Yinghuangia seranimata]MDI2126326.1 TetR/AcrR family transcriptional regulator [Yinghuangia seranimata]
MRKSPTEPAPRRRPDPATRGPGGGRRHFLNRELLLDTAIAVIEKDGHEALTFRRLGAELDVAPTAVYRHFADKDELLRALGERLIEHALDGYEPAPEWRRTVREVAVAARRAYLAHPRVGALALARVTSSDVSFRLTDICLGAFRSLGLDAADAARYYLALVDMTLGSASLESAFAALDPATRAADDAVWGAEFLTASAERFPSLAASAPYMTGAFRDDHFEFTLGLLLDAIELRAAGHA